MIIHAKTFFIVSYWGRNTVEGQLESDVELILLIHEDMHVFQAAAIVNIVKPVLP
jgi:hypothetical protein